MHPDVRDILLLALATLALLVLRAIVAARESSLVAVGLTRALELASAPHAGVRARALESLLRDYEPTAFTGRAHGPCRSGPDRWIESTFAASRLRGSHPAHSH